MPGMRSLLRSTLVELGRHHLEIRHAAGCGEAADNFYIGVVVVIVPTCETIETQVVPFQH